MVEESKKHVTLNITQLPSHPYEQYLIRIGSEDRGLYFEGNEVFIGFYGVASAKR